MTAQTGTQPEAGKNLDGPAQVGASCEVARADFAMHNFVGAVLMYEFVVGASMNAVMASSRWTGPVPLWEHKKGRQPTMPMNCVIDAAAETCAMSTIDSEGALVEVLEAIRAQFEVADECDKEDEAWVLEVLEHVLEDAAVEARRALNEAMAGYPVSGGSVARWIRAERGIDAV